MAMTEDGFLVSFHSPESSLRMESVSQSQQRRRDEGCRASLDYAQAVYTAGGGTYP